MEHKYISAGLFEVATWKWTQLELHGPRCLLFPSPIPPPPIKKNTQTTRVPHSRTPSFPTHPGVDAREDPITGRKVTVDHAHKVLLPPPGEADRDAPITPTEKRVNLTNVPRHLWCTNTSPRHRRRVMGRGQPITDPSPGTIPLICSLCPVLTRVDQILHKRAIFFSRAQGQWFWTRQNLFTVSLCLSIDTEKYTVVS
jgi:hypothetical protein